MPAALAIAPLFGALAVKTTSEPAVPVPLEGVEGFGQVLRSVWGAADGGASGQAEPDPDVATIEATTAGQLAAKAPIPPEKAASQHTEALAAKPSRSAKEDHHAADLDVSVPSPAVVPASEATPAVMANPAVAPPPATIPAATPAATVSPDPAPVSASSGPRVTVRATFAAGGPGGGGKPAQAAVRPAKRPASKEKADQGVSSARAASAPDAAPAEPASAQVNPVAAPVAAMDPTVSAAPVGSGGAAANGETPSVPASGTPDSGGQVALAAADTSTPLQSMSAVGSDALGQLAVVTPVPPRPLPSTAPTEAATTAVPTGDHKITLRPVEAGAGPGQPAGSSGSVQLLGVPATAAATTATTAAPAPAAAAPHKAVPVSPAQQLAPALLTLAKTADGGQQMTVRLHPADLGMVQVRIALAASGATRIDITADNPVTLLALQRDQPQLHRALDDAGIAAAGRTVTFHVAQPAQAVAGVNAPVPANSHGTNQQAAAGRTNAGTTDADGSAGGGRGSYVARERTGHPISRRSSPPSAATGATVVASYRIGLDITA